MKTEEIFNRFCRTCTHARTILSTNKDKHFRCTKAMNQEGRDASTSTFVGHVPKGSDVLTPDPKFQIPADCPFNLEVILIDSK